MTDQPGDWLAAERERDGCATVLGTRAACEMPEKSVVSDTGFALDSAPISMTNSTRGPAFLILFATLMATAGTGISIVAFPWLALQHHDSAKDASIVAAAMAVPL